MSVEALEQLQRCRDDVELIAQAASSDALAKRLALRALGHVDAAITILRERLGRDARRKRDGRRPRTDADSPRTSEDGRTGEGGSVLSDQDHSEIRIKTPSPSLSGDARASADASADWRSELRAVADSLRFGAGNSAALHDAFEAALRARGWDVQREVHVPSIAGHGHNGRIDLVAKLGATTLAIELDNVTPRGRSVLKMQRFPGAIRVCVLRTAAWGWNENQQQWADVVIGMGWNAQDRGLVGQEANDVDALSDDGFVVDAWLDEMKLRTGNALWFRRGFHVSVLNILAATLGATIGTQGDRCAAAREIAREYVEKQKGATFTPHHFADWLRNGRQDRASGVLKTRTQLQPDAPEGKRAWSEGDGK